MGYFLVNVWVSISMGVVVRWVSIGVSIGVVVWGVSVVVVVVVWRVSVVVELWVGFGISSPLDEVLDIAVWGGHMGDGLGVMAVHLWGVGVH